MEEKICVQSRTREDAEQMPESLQCHQKQGRKPQAMFLKEEIIIP